MSKSPLTKGGEGGIFNNGMFFGKWGRMDLTVVMEYLEEHAGVPSPLKRQKQLPITITHLLPN